MQDTLYVGVDAHKKRSHVAVMDQGGTVLKSADIPSSRSGVAGAQPGPRPFLLAIRYHELLADRASHVDRIMAFLDLHVGSKHRQAATAGGPIEENAVLMRWRRSS